MNRILPVLALAVAALAGCGHQRVRSGAAPTGARYMIGHPYFAGGEWHYPRAIATYDRTGVAVVIPPGHGAATTDGEAFHQAGLMAQSPILPLPSLVRVTNLVNGRNLTVRVNDRGPAAPGRIIAVTRKVGSLLGFPTDGVVEVRVTLLGRRSQALQTGLGAGPHLTPAPLAAVQASALPPPPGAAGTSGAVFIAPAVVPPHAAAAATALSGVVRQTAPAPGPLYVEMAGFGSPADAQTLLGRLTPMQGGIIPQNRQGRTLYAAELGPYNSVAAADAALRAVLRRGVPDPEITVR